MSTGNRIGIAGLVGTLFGVAAFYVWPNNRWIGWVCLAIALLLLVAWAYRELTGRTPSANLLTLEPLWQASQQRIWSGLNIRQQRYFRLETALHIRFSNGDDVQHIVKSAELLLLCPRRLWKAKPIARSSYVLKMPKGASQLTEEFKSSGPGIRVEPHSMTEYAWLMFYTPLPAGVSGLPHHLAKVKFEILGRRDKVVKMRVWCPRPYQSVPYSSEAMPLVPEQADDPVK
jgi:hypothetical protein